MNYAQKTPCLNQNTLLTYDSLLHCQRLKQITLNSCSPFERWLFIQLDILEYGVSNFSDLLAWNNKILDLYEDDNESPQLKYICQYSVINLSEIMYALWMKNYDNSKNIARSIMIFTDKTIAILRDISIYLNNDELSMHVNQLVRKEFESENEIFVQLSEFSMEFIKSMKESGDLNRAVKWLLRLTGFGFVASSIAEKLIDNSARIAFNMKLAKYHKQREQMSLLIQKLFAFHEKIGKNSIISEMIAIYANHIYEMDCAIVKCKKTASRKWCLPVILISLLWALCSSSMTPDFILALTLFIYFFPSLQKMFLLYKCKKQRDEHMNISECFISY